MHLYDRTFIKIGHQEIEIIVMTFISKYTGWWENNQSFQLI